jgi:hypothetical protein
MMRVRDRSPITFGMRHDIDWAVLKVSTSVFEHDRGCM